MAATTMEGVLDEELAIDESKINVEALLKDFKHYYVKLKESMDKHRSDNSNKDCYILFGISGAGKSTTVARLTSDEHPRSFWERLIADKEANRSYSEVNGINIGHTVNSCTVIPQSYKISDDLHICDMPGFAENDPQKKISIDLLSKIFLTNTKNLKIIVVAEVGILFEDMRLTKLQQNYHNDLENLLGAKYPEAIDHFYFVLTKNHKLKKTSQEIENRMTKCILQLMKAKGVDADFPRFLSRLIDAHVIVDLETSDNKDLLSSINHLMIEDRKEHEVHRIQEWSIDHLEAGENLLNRLCLRHIAKQSQAVRELEINKDKLISESNVRFTLDDETKDLSHKMEQVLQKIPAAKKRVDDCRRSINDYAPKKKDLLARRKEAEDLKAMCLRRQEIFSSNGGNDGRRRYVIQTRVDASLQQKGSVTSSMTGKNKESHLLKMNPKLLGDGCIGYAIVVAEYEADDTTLRDAFKTGNSLIPNTMEDLKKLTQPSILYNTTNDLKRCSVERPGSKMAKEDVPLTVKYDRPFKVYIFTQTPFESVYFFKQIKEDFIHETNEAELKIQHSIQALDDLDKKLKQDQKNVRRLEIEYNNACNEVNHIKEEVKQAQKKHEGTFDEIISKLTKGHESVAQARTDPRLADINDVIKILRMNSIATSAGEPLQKLDASFLPLENSLDETIKTLTMEKYNNRDALTDILSMTLPSTPTGNYNSYENGGKDYVPLEPPTFRSSSILSGFTGSCSSLSAGQSPGRMF